MDSTHVLILVIFSFVSEVFTNECKCPATSQCDPITTWNENEREVIIMTNHSTSYHEWMWDSITTVISHSDSGNNDLMCYAHSKGKKYGLYSDQIPLDYNITLEMKSFVAVIKEEIELTRADVAAIDLNAYLSPCNTKQAKVPEINYTLKTVIRDIKNSTKARVLCVVPWKPPCFDSDCSVVAGLSDVCDAAIFSPESFSTSCKEPCIARATVSFNRVTLGMIEYMTFGFKSSQLVLGIPWFGYNYTCQDGDTVNMLSDFPLCRLKEVNGTCDFKGSRRQLPIIDYETEHPEMIYTDDHYSKAAQAPWKVEKFKTDDNKTETFVTWFEDMGSLNTKYGIISDLNLKGCAIYYGEDLSSAKIATRNEFKDHMWSWLIHTTLVTGSSTTHNKVFNTAATVAAVGVSMFVFGCLMGLLIACIIFRRKKRLQAPFRHDQLTEDFTDDNEL